METEALGPDSDHSPTVEKDNAECDDVEHGFGSQLITLLNEPKHVNTDSLVVAIMLDMPWRYHFGVLAYLCCNSHD